MAVLANLSPLEIGLIFLINSGVLLALSSRWWLILVGSGWHPGYWAVSCYRLAGFSISYFTPGPQVGGEPLLVQLLRQRQGLTTEEAAASVALDKSLELAVNFGFLVFGVLVALLLGWLPAGNRWPILALALVLLLIPLTHLGLASRGKRPVAGLLSQLPARWQRAGFIGSLITMVHDTESLVADFLMRRPAWVLLALAASVFSWLLLIGEYWLMARFLGLELSAFAAIAALTAARLAILLPSPAGLGTLEASQVLAFSSLLGSADAGAALAVVIRGRDLLFGVIGLLLVGYFTGGVGHERQQEGGRKRPTGG